MSFKIFKAYKFPRSGDAKVLKDAKDIVTKKAGIAKLGSRRRVANLVCFGTRGFKGPLFRQLPLAQKQARKRERRTENPTPSALYPRR